MNSPDAALAAPPHACSACGGALDVLGKCASCGAVFGEAYRCPLCQALSGVEPHPLLRLACRSCGGPRIAPNVSPISEPEIELLETARREQLRSGAFRAGAAFAFASGVLSVLVTLVVLLVTAPSPSAQVAVWLASAVPFALAWFALGRARGELRELNTALERAWLLAASRITKAAGGTLSADALARALHTDSDRAELYLAELSLEPSASLGSASPRVRVSERTAPVDPSAPAEPAPATRDANKF